MTMTETLSFGGKNNDSYLKVINDLHMTLKVIFENY